MSGFDSPNYTQVPNDLFEKHMSTMGYAELKVVMVLIRETFGYHRTKKRMSIRKLSKATGLTPRNAYNGALEAVNRGLISMTQDGGVTIWSVIVEDTKNETVSPIDTPKNETVSPVNTPSKKEKNLKEKHRAEKTQREVDPLFNAIAEVCNVDPSTSGSSIGKIKSILMKSNPPYTADEVKKFGEMWWSWKDRTVAPTIWQLKERIGNVRATKQNIKPFEKVLEFTA